MKFQARDASWTLDQALLWIATRDVSVVDTASPEERRPLVWSWFCLDDLARPHSPHESWRDVEADLLSKLRHGEVGARRDLDLVPSLWFHEADYHMGQNRTSFERRPLHGTQRGQWVGWGDPEQLDARFSPADLVGIWPALSGDIENPCASEEAEAVSFTPGRFSEADAKAKAADIVAEAEREGCRLSREDFVSLLQQRVPGVTTIAARKAWMDTRPEDWSKPGPRGPRNHASNRAK